MTESDAIKEFQQNIDMPFGSNISREASELAIQALEKQIPKKPIYIANLGYAALWLCPVCERRIVRSDLKYCHQCGQKLDWSDENEID